METFFVLFLSVLAFSQAVEYKLCATFEHEPLCKWIEASRNEIICVRVSDSVDCLVKMQRNEVDFGTFYPEEAFLAAHFLKDSGVVLAEVRHPDRADRPFNFETVAVVRKTLFGGLSALKGLSYCHPGFSKAQYWSDRVLKDFERKVLEHFKDDIGCNSGLRPAYEDELYRLSLVFGKACRPGTWAVSDYWDKRLKREYHSLCEQCEHPTTCSYKVQNKGRHSDALRCLVLHGGNVTYTALEFVKEYFELDSEEVLLAPEHRHPSRFNFLCPDGTTRPLTSGDSCSWIKQPWTSVIALKSSSPEMLKNLKEWLREDQNAAWTKHLKNILVKGNGVLKFRDEPISVANYLKEGRSIPSMENESCNTAIKWCTVTETENNKCEYIATAALIHGLPNRIKCIGGLSKIDCLKKIRCSESDIVYIDSELGYISRKIFNLTPAAYLETQRSGNYYGVIVFKMNKINSFKDLKGKKACFPQYNGLGKDQPPIGRRIQGLRSTGASENRWLTYIEALKTFSIIPSRSCSNSKKAWDFFSEACAPGARNLQMNNNPEKISERLCKSCTTSVPGTYCLASSTNPYFGETGALRCLNSGDGDVAFLDFYALKRYLASNRQNTPEANMKPEDFKILCRDGTIGNLNMSNPDKCSFIQVNGGEVVTRNDLSPVEKRDISHTLMELDDLFGTTSRSYNPALKMFEPFDDEENVLFKESAVSLVSTFETQNSFVNNYIKLLNSMENCLTDGTGFTLIPSLFAILVSLVLCLVNFKF